MIDLSADLRFLRPAWLLLLLALPLLAWWWRARERRHSTWRDVVDPHLLPHLLEGGLGGRGRGVPWLALAAFMLAVCALAGPSWRSTGQPLQVGGAPLVVALDLSSATMAGDLPPSRLLQARARLADLLRERDGPVGLVAFADDAFTVAPLTDDAGNVALFLDALSPEIMPVDGSRPDRAIELAATLLRQAGAGSGDILLFTDDASRAAGQAAARALGEGFRVSVLGMGTETGAAYRRHDGSITTSRLDPGALRALAQAGGGSYAAWTDADTLPVAGGALAATADSLRDGARVPEDGGYWLLPLVMLLAAFAFRRGGALALLLVCACLPLRPALAQDDIEGGAWKRADQVVHGRRVDAEAAYRAGDFAAAARAFEALPGADAAYNRGNALARAGRYEDAIAAYDEALELSPGMEDAQANRNAVEAAMKRKPPPSPRDGSRGEREDTPDEGKPRPDPGEAGGDDADGSADEGEAGEPGQPQQLPQADDRDGEPREPPPRAGADDEAQRTANDAQREAMQRAIEGGGPADDGEDVEGDPERAQSASEREQAQANAAWLRRVPDDPGGLLRAKFRLEHERRRRSGEDER